MQRNTEKGKWEQRWKEDWKQGENGERKESKNK
jgi:hypothetical protein